MKILGRTLEQYTSNLGRYHTFFGHSLRACSTFRQPWSVLYHYATMTGVANRSIELRNGLKIMLSDHPHDVITAFVVFAKKDYGHIARGSTVVDVGANVGILSLYAVSRGAARVYAYEPNAQSFAHLQRNIQQNRLDSVILPHRVAVTGRGGDVVKFPVESSAYGAILPDDTTAGFELVPTTSLEHIMRDNHLDRVHLLKLDCEGAEYEIVGQTPGEVWDRVDAVRLEYHRGRPEDIIAALGRRGLAVELHRPDPNGRGMLWFRRFPSSRQQA